MTTTISFKKIQVLGITTDFNSCDCCGKENLKKTVTILDLSSGIEGHFGVVCAAAIDKYDTLDAAKEAKKEISKAVRKHDDKIQSAHRLAYNTLRKVFGVVRIADNAVKVNCDEITYNNCFEAALKHLSGPISVFNYSI
jgi:hypothetical protein